MSQLKLLINKDLTILRNTHFRSPKQVAVFFVLAAFLTLITGVLTRAAVSWFRPLMAELPLEVAGVMIYQLMMIVYTWLAFLFFFSTIQESKNRFFLTPDLTLLMSAPVKPGLIFSLRFFVFTCFNSSSFFQLSLLGFAPLIALGVLGSASWYYYALLFPATYLFLVIPAAFGLTLIMLLMRVLSPKRLFQLAGVFNLVLGLLWFAFILGDQERIMARLLTLFEDTGFSLGLTPLGASVDFLAAVLGIGEGWVGPFLLLIGWAAAAVLLAMLIVSRVYYFNYERMQVAETAKPVKNKERAGKEKKNQVFPFQSTRSFLVLSHWKMALRNKEMAQGAYGIVMLLVAYVFIMGRIFDGAVPLVAVVNVAVISYFVNVLVQMFFLPFAMINDRQVLQRQYWLLKSSPVGAKTVTLSLVLANIIPALPLGLLALVTANYFTGISAEVALLSPVLLVLVLFSSAAVFLVATIMEAGEIGEDVPLLGKVLRELIPVLIIVAALLPMVVGLYYRELRFLSFMHSLSGQGVMAVAVFLTVGITLVIIRISLRRMQLEWDLLEIK